MKKKNLIIIAIVLLVLFISAIVLYTLRPNKYDISKIVMRDSISSVELTKTSQIEEIMEVLTSYKNTAEQTDYEQKDGYAFSFDIYYKDETTDHVVVNSTEMIYDEIGYVSSEEFCEELGNFYQKNNK